MNEGEESTGSEAEVIQFRRAERDVGRYRFRIEESTDGQRPYFYVSFKKGLWGGRRWVRYGNYSARTFELADGEYYFHDLREANRALDWALDWAHDFAARQVVNKRAERMKKIRTVIHREP